MNQKTKIAKNLILAAIATLGLSASAFAQDPMKAPPNPAAPTASGLLGSTYAGVAWNSYRLNDGPPSAGHGATAYFNQSLADDLDFSVSYDWMRAHSAVLSTTEQKLDWSVTGYTKQDWGKPFVTVGIAHAWRNGDVTGRHGSWGFGADMGIEFQAAPALAITPFVGWDRETSFSRNATRYGLRTTYRVSREWSVTATAQYLEVKRMANRAEYSLGLNYHF